jgi:hypothetical protein
MRQTRADVADHGHAMAGQADRAAQDDRPAIAISAPGIRRVLILAASMTAITASVTAAVWGLASGSAASVFVRLLTVPVPAGAIPSMSGSCLAATRMPTPAQRLHHTPDRIPGPVDLLMQPPRWRALGHQLSDPPPFLIGDLIHSAPPPKIQLDSGRGVALIH